ncbi:MAG: hypothetical protein Q8P11_00545 [bacterium]|nr:hypothetical protein [bacterium]
MGSLSIGKYAGLCVLGGEVAYLICDAYGWFLTGSALELHSALFALLPGYGAGNAVGVLAGAVSIALWSGLGGAYVAWVHNVSIKK